MSHCQHGSSWPSLATHLYCPLLPVVLQGYILYQNREIFGSFLSNCWVAFGRPFYLWMVLLDVPRHWRVPQVTGGHPHSRRYFWPYQTRVGFGPATGPTLKTALCHIRALVGRMINNQSSCIYVLAGLLAFSSPCDGVLRNMSLMSSSLLLQQYPACLVRLICRVSWWVLGGSIAAVLCGVASRTCSIQLAPLLCYCRQAFSPYVLLTSM